MTKQMLLPLLLIFLVGCEPATLIIGGGAALGTLATREKGIGGTASDNWLITQIKGKIYKFNHDLYVHIEIDAQNGEVLLNGEVPNRQWIADAERIAWQVQGVKQVNNHIKYVSRDKQTVGAGSYTKDSFATTQIKTHLLFDMNVKSLNYSVKTVDGIVYLTGIAQSQTELDRVVSYASKVKGVQKVMNFVKIKDDDPQQGGGTSTSSDIVEETLPEADVSEQSPKSSSKSPKENDTPSSDESSNQEEVVPEDSD